MILDHLRFYNLNKTPQAANCGATLVASVSLASKFAFYNDILAKENCQKNKVTHRIKNFSICYP